MLTSPNLRRLAAHLLICSLFVAGLSSLKTQVSSASANHLPPPSTSTASASTEQPVTQAKTVDKATRERVSKAYNKLPLSFEENRGQVDAEVRYISRGAGYTLFLTPTEAVLSLRSADGETPGKKKSAPPHHQPQAGSRKSRSAVLRMKLHGANRSPAVTGESEMQAQTNYFKGNDPKNWHTGAARFERVRYSQVYPGVDMVYYGSQQELEYDFEVAPGADTSRIVLEFKGVRRIKVERGTGELVLKTAGGEVRQRRPVAYQEVGGERREVASRYVMKGGREVGIEVGEYDRARPLVIDPVLTYSTYLGGSFHESNQGLALDPSGMVYVTGYTQSTDFPKLNPYKESLEGYADIFISKLNPNLSGAASLLYSTYLGGSRADIANDIALDPSGRVYVTGYTDSPDFPTLNQYQGKRGGENSLDAFVIKLDLDMPGASALLYGTYLGGSENEFATGIAVDAAGNAYVAGSTQSLDFPKLHQLKVRQGDVDAFVAKINTNASGAASLVYSTCLGGIYWDNAYAIAADPSGIVYVAGGTNSPDFPKLYQYQAQQPEGAHVFVTKLDTNLSGSAALLYSTLLGGDSYEYAYAIAADPAGIVYIAGTTTSSDFPTLNEYQKRQPGGSYFDYDAFVAKLDTNLSGASSLLYSTYLGGIFHDIASEIALDSSGNVYVLGITYSPDFPTLNRLQPFRGGYYDAFVVKLNPARSGAAALIYSTYLGGSGDESAGGLATDSAGHAYVSGSTSSNNFPTLRQYQKLPGYDYYYNVFVTKLADTYLISGRVTSDGTTGLSGVTVTLGGSKSAVAITNSSGRYYFANLTMGGDYTVTASKGSLTFINGRRAFNDLRDNQTGIDFRTRPAAVSGRVTVGKDTGEGLGGVTITLTGGTGFAPRTATTTSTGTYSFGNLPTPRSYKVTPSKTGYNFDPAQLALINLTGNQSGANFTASPKTNTVLTGTGP